MVYVFRGSPSVTCHPGAFRVLAIRDRLNHPACVLDSAGSGHPLPVLPGAQPVDFTTALLAQPGRLGFGQEVRSWITSFFQLENNNPFRDTRSIPGFRIYLGGSSRLVRTIASIKHPPLRISHLLIAHPNIFNFFRHRNGFE